MKNINKVALVVLAIAMSGCAPSAQHIELKKAEMVSLTAVQLAIVNGYYGNERKEEEKKENQEKEFFSDEEKPVAQTEASARSISDRLPLPEGDGPGGDIPCSTKCLDNCDEQCKVECPELYNEMCGNDEFDFGEITADDLPAVEPVKIKEKPPSVEAKASTPGDNNNQTNIVGDGNKILVQGGAGPNSTGANPIEKAMADLLRARVAPIKTTGEIVGEQAREFIESATDSAIKLAPAVLTGTAIVTAGEAIKAGFEEAGDKYENSNNPDNSDHSIRYGFEEEESEESEEPVIEE